MQYPVAFSVLRSLRAVVAAVAVAGLAACGGGGDDGLDLACGGTQQLQLSFGYEINGTLVDASRPITLPAGVAIVAVPRIVGLPAACLSAARLKVSHLQEFRGPTGITVDTNTGVLTGTVIGRGSVSFRLTLNVDGYVNPLVEDVDFFM